VKNLCLSFSALVVASVLAKAQQAPLPQADQRAVSIASSGAIAHQEDTPAQQRIEAAKLQLKASPKKLQALNELAIAYIRRVRESADRKYLQDADAAIQQGLSVDAQDFQLQKTQVVLMLSRHEYVKAKERAEILNKQTPDDVMLYGYLAEADIALGDYEAAEASAQWMLNMRQNNVPGLLIGAELRTLYGDANGAIEFLNLAYSESSPLEVEDLAWIANKIAAIEISRGNIDAGAAMVTRAEELFPGYYVTLEDMSRVKLAQHHADEAVTLLKQATQVDSDPHVIYELAEAQRGAGDETGARASYAQFEKAAGAKAMQSDSATRDLIVMYARDASRAAEALQVAQREIGARHDVWTLDAYAWALYANGKFAEADTAIQKAIAVGVQDAEIFDHAGHIAEKLNRKEDAAKDFELSLRTNPLSTVASDARASLGMSDAVRESQQAGGAVAQSPFLSQPAVSGGMGNDRMVGVPVAEASVEAFAPVPASLLVPRPTGTDRAIHSAQGLVATDPKNAKGYAALGAAHFQRARETGDVNDYQMAEDSLTKSLDLVADDFSAGDTLATMAEVCMGEHRFADALTYSHKALSLGSGDVSPFAIIGDAYADMGEYDKAAEAYARLTPRDMTLSPRAAYARDSRIAYLNFISGDTAGAIQLMKIAVAEGTEAKIPAENLAWLYYELGEFDAQAGDAVAADVAYVTALTIYPGDYRALAALGKLRANQGKYDEAIMLYQKAIAVVPMPIFVAELGDLYRRVGNEAEAKKQYQLVEYIGLLGKINAVLHNRDLALFYADHDMKLAEALELAQKEFEVRQDVYTWDALAWALYKNGKYADAAKASEKALQFSTRDSLLLFHAGMIAERMGQQQQARAHLAKALEINPRFHLVYAREAQETLSHMNVQTASRENNAR